MEEGVQIFDDEPEWDEKLSPLTQEELDLWKDPPPPLLEEEYSSYDSEPEEEVMDAITFARSLETVHERMKPFYREFPPEPKDPQAILSYLLFYSCMHVIYDNFNPEPQKPSMNDSDAQLREKTFGIHFLACYHKFCKIVRDLSTEFYVALERNLISRCGEEHPLTQLLPKFNEHAELHSRRLKGNPTGQKKRADGVVLPFINIVNGIEYDMENLEHRKWRWLIFNPLRTDMDQNAINYAEADDIERVQMDLDHIQGVESHEDPYGPIVTPEWNTLLCLLHTFLHIEDYLAVRILKPVLSMTEDLSVMKWDQLWSAIVTPEYAKKSIEKYSREKKKTPEIVSRIAEFRDLFKEGLFIVNDMVLLEKSTI